MLFASGAHSLDSASGVSFERPGMWVREVIDIPTTASMRAISAMILFISTERLAFFAIAERAPRLSERSSKDVDGPSQFDHSLMATAIARASQSVVNAGSPIFALKRSTSPC